ncbi:11849_t:CDS:1, partial [Racocetra persica]
VNFEKFKGLDNIVTNLKEIFTYSSSRKKRWLEYLTLNTILHSTLPLFDKDDNFFNSENITNITLLPLPIKT